MICLCVCVQKNYNKQNTFTQFLCELNSILDKKNNIHLNLSVAFWFVVVVVVVSLRLYIIYWDWEGWKEER